MPTIRTCPLLALRSARAPTLRTFALSLCGDIDRAEDLAQETLLRALTHVGSFQPGTNLPAWLVTILRNRFREEYRKRQREVEDVDGHYAETLVSRPEQTGRLEFEELRAALAKLGKSDPLLVDVVELDWKWLPAQ